MKYYNSKGELVDYNLGLSFNHGTCANIYRVNDECFKNYYAYTEDKRRIDLEVFKIIKKINHNSVYKLQDVFYEKEKISSRERLLAGLEDFLCDAYSYLYVVESKIEIFDVDCEYLVNSIRNLEEFILELSEYYIDIHDFRRENVVYTANGIVLIDLDCFEKSIIKTDNNRLDNILKLNRERLIILLKDLFRKSKKCTPHCKKGLDRLFSFDNLENISESISKRLVKYKSVNEYLENN